MIRAYKNRTLVWGLIALMTATPSLVCAQEGAAAGAAQKIEYSYVTPGAVATVVAHPRRVLTSPQMEWAPVEVISAAGKQELGLDPLDVEQVMAIIEPPAEGPPDYGVILRLSKSIRLEALTPPPDLPLVDDQLEGRPYRRSEHPLSPGFYMPDDKTLIVATDSFLKKSLANHKNPVEGPLSRLLTRINDTSDAFALAVVEPVRPMLNSQLENAPLPPPFDSARRLPDLIEAAKADVTVAGRMSASFLLLAPSEEDAQELEAILNQYVDLGQQMALAQIANEMPGSDDPVEQASAQYAQRMTRRMIEMLRPQREGKVLRISHDGASGQMATMGILVALLLPAVQAAREAARRVSSTNNLKQIALAMHNYHDTYRTFPPRANFDANGKPLLSWRVHILPFVEQQPLYEQFRLNEPWDSAHNRTLIDQIPAIYRNPTSTAEPTLSNYLVPTGPGSIFESDEGTGLRNIIDGSSNTILVVEADDEASVIWTKPDDLDYTTEDPLAGLGAAHPGGFNVALSDGSVRFIAATIDPEMFLRLLMMNDGKPVVLEP